MQYCQPEARLSPRANSSGPFSLQMIYEAAGRLHTTPMLSPILARLHSTDVSSNGSARTFCILAKHDSNAAQYHAGVTRPLGVQRSVGSSTRLRLCAKLATHSYQFHQEDEASSSLVADVEVDQTLSRNLHKPSHELPNIGLCAGRPCVSCLVETGQTISGSRRMPTTSKGKSRHEEARPSSQRSSLPVDASIFPHICTSTSQVLG